MPIYKVPNVKLVAQPKNALCWWACDQMLYKWSQATGNGSMVDPIDPSTTFKGRYDDNLTVHCKDNTFMASKMSMKTQKSIPMNYAGLVEFLSAHGPVFTSVYKNWTADQYGHAIVIAGCADTGVWIMDPMPVGFGSSTWLTWSQIQSAIDDVAGEANPSFLTAA